MRHFIGSCFVAFAYCTLFATLVAAAMLLIQTVFIPFFTYEF